MAEGDLLKMLPEWLRIAMVVLLIMKGPEGLKWGSAKIKELRNGGKPQPSNDGTVQYAIENQVVPILDEISNGIHKLHLENEHLTAQVRRTADIQISNCRAMNEFTKIMTVLCDRARIDRPDVIQFPESHNTPFTHGGDS